MTRMVSLRGGIALGLLSVLSMSGCAVLSQTQEGAIIGSEEYRKRLGGEER